MTSVHWNREFRGYLINDWPPLKSGVIRALIPLPFSSCCRTMDQAPSFPWVTHLITAPSSLIPNSVGRACQTAYAGRRGDFEMLLMTLGYNYPLSLLHPLTLSLLSTPVICTRGHPLSCSLQLSGSTDSKMQGRGREGKQGLILFLCVMIQTGCGQAVGAKVVKG